MTDSLAPSKLLLVEDDQAFRTVYRSLLQDAGYEVHEADDRQAARNALALDSFPVVLLDLMLPPDGTIQEGLNQLQAILETHHSTKVIVVSGAGDIHQMLQAIKMGAYDFLTKPVDPDVLLIVVERAMALARLEKQVNQLQDSLAQHQPDHTIIGNSPVLQRALDIATRIAPTDLPVLLTGEHGTGKELFARLIHKRSQRSHKPLIVVNCGALPEQLLESTLFGHKKGSFTGAIRDHKGLFEEANGGTLFLDEIGDMPLPLQVKVLRALESGEIRPVGATHTIQVDVRLLSATNRDLLQLQREGHFREDLYWRINGTELTLPPLRDRRVDLPLLATHFLNLSASLCADGLPKRLTDEGLQTLLTHQWPGNLRELRHEMQRATIMAGTRSLLGPDDFRWHHATTPSSSQTHLTLAEKVEALERQEIEAALIQHNGNRTHTAKALGLSRQGLLKKMNRYGLA
jgi:DNA-binding NtrC family response regulator